MAQAKILYHDTTGPDEKNGGFCDGIIVKVIYIGADAPIRNSNGTLIVSIKPTFTPADIESAMADAIRADAVSRGFVIKPAAIDYFGKNL